jgi:hypothetical protein
MIAYFSFHKTKPVTTAGRLKGDNGEIIADSAQGHAITMPRKLASHAGLVIGDKPLS